MKFHFSQRNVELPTPGKLLNCEDNLFVVFQKISIPPTEGTFVLDPQPPGFSIPGDACHIPPPPPPGISVIFQLGWVTHGKNTFVKNAVAL